MIGNRTKLYFDRKAVTDQIGKKKAAGLSRVGAIGRRTMRKKFKNPPVRQIRQKDVAKKLKGLKGPALLKAAREQSLTVHAPAGKPPFNQTGRMKNLTEFAFEPDKASVVVGPAIFPQAAGTSPDQGTVPGALERSGTVIIKAKRTRRGKMKPARKVKIRKHPFAEPTLQEVAPTFAELFGE